MFFFVWLKRITCLFVYLKLETFMHAINFNITQGVKLIMEINILNKCPICGNIRPHSFVRWRRQWRRFASDGAWRCLWSHYEVSLNRDWYRPLPPSFTFWPKIQDDSILVNLSIERIEISERKLQFYTFK